MLVSAERMEIGVADKVTTSGAAQPPAHGSPLISTRLLSWLTAAIAVLALLTLGIFVAGSRYGAWLALGDHTENTEVFEITIGQDTVLLPANAIRFARQRSSGKTERVDLYLTWPEMAGYSAADRLRFNDVSAQPSLLFMELAQSTMSRDMSGRLKPIYAHLFEGPAQAGPYGLTLHQLRRNAGYTGEILLTAARAGKPDYAVRCILPETPQHASSSDCQRDIHAGRDLTVLYRFSSTMLADWERIDASVQSFIEARLVP